MTTQKVVTEREYEETLEIKDNLRKQLITSGIFELVINEKPYFVANDIARALGYKRPADAITQHCKGSVKHRYLTDGGEQEVKFIPEGDIYRWNCQEKCSRINSLNSICSYAARSVSSCNNLYTAGG